MALVCGAVNVTPSAVLRIIQVIVYAQILGCG
jgi:hypothetical protein